VAGRGRRPVPGRTDGVAGRETQVELFDAGLASAEAAKSRGLRPPCNYHVTRNYITSIVADMSNALVRVIRI
jgi:hypothetical protein